MTVAGTKTPKRRWAVYDYISGLQVGGWVTDPDSGLAIKVNLAFEEALSTPYKSYGMLRNRDHEGEREKNPRDAYPWYQRCMETMMDCADSLVL